MPTIKVPTSINFEERELRFPGFGRFKPSAASSVPPPPVQPPTAPTYDDNSFPDRTDGATKEATFLVIDRIDEKTCCCGFSPLRVGCLYIAIAGIILSVIGFVYYAYYGSPMFTLPLFTLFSYTLLILGYWRQMPWLYVTHVLFQVSVISFMLFISLILVLGGSAVTWLGSQIYINLNGHYYGILGFFIFLCCALNSYFIAVTCIGWRQLRVIQKRRGRADIA